MALTLPTLNGQPARACPKPPKREPKQRTRIRVKANSMVALIDSLELARWQPRYSQTPLLTERLAIAGPDECWLWIGRGCDVDGYPLIARGSRKSIRASRYVWGLLHGPIPPRMLVCHKCDTPRCCNPTHLFLGTNADNMRDKVTKGRQAMGEKNVSAKLTAATVVEIRQMSRDGTSGAELARRFHVTRNAIHLVLHRRTWMHIA